MEFHVSTLHKWAAGVPMESAVLTGIVDAIPDHMHPTVHHDGAAGLLTVKVRVDADDLYTAAATAAAQMPEAVRLAGPAAAVEVVTAEEHLARLGGPAELARVEAWIAAETAGA
jgi:hypothetical protein